MQPDVAGLPQQLRQCQERIVGRDHLPSLLSRAAPPPWDAIETALGMRLPSDYREFIEFYGAGGSNNELAIWYPVRRRPDSIEALTVLIEDPLLYLQLLWASLSMCKYNVPELYSFPEPSGLL
jgi:hypothetical protein